MEPVHAASLPYRLPERPPQRPPLLPPDPEAPVGPPPAFESTPLERTYERLRTEATAGAPDRRDAPAPADPAARHIDVLT